MPAKDDEIWEIYKRGVKTVPPARAPVRKTPQKKAVIAAPLPVPRGEGQPIAAHALERRREKRLRSGEIEIHAKLDLHGMTQVEAFAALATFMHKAAKAGKRHLLIITGKGAGGTGVLRTSLKQWLGQLPEAKVVLAVRQAAVLHGGDGAFYVILRARRS
ncbi:MAG: Smr/MutS family protein [Alphaproteobacteria bacterium]|nr:Smr/MutS family protein [Alphaproteobacteria bacterium]